MFENVTFHGKELVESGHFKDELYNVYRKNLDLVLEILEKGTYNRESKDKTMVLKKTRGGTWELVYVETEIVLVHLKLRR